MHQRAHARQVKCWAAWCWIRLMGPDSRPLGAHLAIECCAFRPSRMQERGDLMQRTESLSSDLKEEKARTVRTTLWFSICRLKEMNSAGDRFRQINPIRWMAYEFRMGSSQLPRWRTIHVLKLIYPWIWNIYTLGRRRVIAEQAKSKGAVI